ncbi:energy transducer TonB [Lacinutrix chionoecetis]
MKHLLILVTLLFSFFSFSQENSSELKDEYPVHINCDENLTNTQRKKCMQKEMMQLISENFNLKLANTLNLQSGTIKIRTQYNINKEGLIDSIKINAPHPQLEKEALRVLQLAPKFKKPALIKGEPVAIKYNLPIIFNVENTHKKLTKKESKALDREAKKRAKKLKKENKNKQL